MKNYSKFVSSVIVATCVILSCSKKSDPGPTQASLLIGSWKQVSTVITGCANSADNVPLTNCTPDCETAVWTATTLKITIPGVGDLNYTYTVNGNTLTITPNPQPGKNTFMVSGQILTLTYKDLAAYGGCSFVVAFKRM